MKDHIRIRSGRYTYFLDGAVVTEAEYRARYPLPKRAATKFANRNRRGKWHLASNSMAVLPHQVEAAKAADKKKGAPGVEYELTKDGYAARPVFESLHQQRQWLRAHNGANYDDNM